MMLTLPSTPSLIFLWLTVRHKAGGSKLRDHKTIAASLLTPPKQTNGKISGNIYSN